MVILDKINEYLNRFLMVVAGLFLLGMIFLTCANVFLRIVWKPVSGTFELMGYFGAVLTAFVLGYTQMKKGHIAIDIVVLGFSKTAQKVLNAINDLICMAFFAIVAWQIASHGRKHHAGTALFGESGSCRALGLATFLTVSEQAWRES